MKIHKFATKGALFGYFLVRILKYYCHIWNQHHRICKTAKFGEKNENSQISDQKCLILVFCAGLWEQYSRILNQHPRIFLIWKFREIMKMHKFGNENALFTYFWGRILKKLLSYFISAPSNSLNCKILWKLWKCLDLALIMLYLGIFGLEFQSNILIFQISTIKHVELQYFLKKWSFNLSYFKLIPSNFSSCKNFVKN